jgi:hypothetical protein
MALWVAGKLRYRTVPLAGAQSGRCRQGHRRCSDVTRRLARAFFCRRAWPDSGARASPTRDAPVDEKPEIGWSLWRRRLTIAGWLRFTDLAAFSVMLSPTGSPNFFAITILSASRASISINIAMPGCIEPPVHVESEWGESTCDSCAPLCAGGDGSTVVPTATLLARFGKSPQ